MPGMAKTLANVPGPFGIGLSIVGTAVDKNRMQKALASQGMSDTDAAATSGGYYGGQIAGNMASALTGGLLGSVVSNPAVMGLAKVAMKEAQPAFSSMMTDRIAKDIAAGKTGSAAAPGSAGKDNAIAPAFGLASSMQRAEPVSIGSDFMDFMNKYGGAA